MLKDKNQQSPAPFSDFLHLVKKAAVHFCVELIPGAEKNGVSQQVQLILNGNLAENRKNEIKRIFNAIDRAAKGEESTEHHSFSAITPDKEQNLPEWVSSELSRLNKSRLPCSLLLIRYLGPENSYSNKKASAILQQEFESSHHVICMDDRTLALLLPGQNRARAMRKARAIHQSLAVHFTGRIVIGLSVCMTGEEVKPEEFINQAHTEIQKGELETGDIFYTFNDSDDCSCQVTAEERSQLLSFANRESKV